MYNEDPDILIEQINLDYVRRWEAEGLSDWNTLVKIESLPILNPTLLHIAVWNSDEELFDYLVSKNVDLELSFVNGTALHLAVYKCENNLNILKKLIALGVPLDKRECCMHWTPLHLACFQGKVDVVDLLIDAGADINITHIYDFFEPEKNLGNSPLHVAIEANQEMTVTTLCRKQANVDAESLETGTPLIQAIINERIEIVKTLIYYDADINIVSKISRIKPDLSSQRGYTLVKVNPMTALHAAIVKSNNQMIKLLLLLSKTDLNVLIGGYFTPLHCAIKYNSPMLKELLSAGADINVLTLENKTILDFCIDEWPKGTAERETIGRLLIEHATKLHVIGDYVHPMVITDGNYAEQCNQELKRMRQYVISGQSITIDQILGCVHNLSRILTIPQIKCLLEPAINRIFPIYGDIIQYRAVRVYQRRGLFSGSGLNYIWRFLFKTVFNELLSEEFIAKIIPYLSYNDLVEILKKKLRELN